MELIVCQGRRLFLLEFRGPSGLEFGGTILFSCFFQPVFTYNLNFQ